jgi:hypothetical protein
VDEDVRAQIRLALDRLAVIVERSQHLPLQKVAGSVLVVGRDGGVVDDVCRRITELGHRTLEALTDIDSIRLLGTRSVAAVVLGESVEESSRERITARSLELHPAAPIIVTGDPHAAASEVDDALRYPDPTG